MSAAIRLEVAREKVAEMTDLRLNALDGRRSMGSDLWNLAERVGVAYFKMERLIRQERFRRGLLKLTDLTPQERREMVKLEGIDLHAIAAGPIMDIGEIYLPAGKLSMAETRAREAAQIIAPIEAGTAETVEQGSARRAKAGSAPKDRA